jgi:Zn-dependent protease/predicted transcriptional regulator
MRAIAFTNPFSRTRLSFHITCYLGFVLIIAIVVTQFSEYYPFGQRLLLGFIASLLLSAAIIARQLAINVTSHYRHIPLKGVELFPFGGLLHLAREETLPILEILLAVVGLLSSLLVVALFYIIYLVLVVNGNVTFAWLIQWLVYINLALFLAHLIPAFPLDGGRILRAVMWRVTRNYARATRITTRIGQGTGIVFLAGGIVLLINREWFTGLLMVFFGWILYLAATRSISNISLLQSLENVTVKQIMSREFSLIPRQLTLDQLAKDYILNNGQYQFVVFDEDRLQGMLTTHEMKSVPRKIWETTPVGQVMIPSSPQTTASTGQLASELLDRMNVYRIKYMPVLDVNQVVGIISRDSLMRFNRTRRDLKI